MARSRSRTTTWTGPSRSVAGSTGASGTAPPEEVADEERDQERRGERARVLQATLDHRADQVGRGELGLGGLRAAGRSGAARGRRRADAALAADPARAATGGRAGPAARGHAG